jgi:putative nucleotidyltransferase with HDIG domain
MPPTDRTLKSRLRELEAIEAITRSLRDAQTSDEIAEMLVLETIQLMHSSHATVLIEFEDGRLWPRASHGLFAPISPFAVITSGPGIDALRIGEVIYSDEALSEESHGDPFSFATPGHAQLYAPMLTSSGKPLGVLISARDLEISFDDLDNRMLGLIAETAALALERVRALEHLQSQVFESQALLEISQLLERADEDAIPMALERIMTLVAADVVTITEKQSGSIRVLHSVGTPNPGLHGFLQRGLSLLEAEGLQLPHAGTLELSDTDPHPAAALMRSAGVKTVYTVPLQHDPYRGMAVYRLKRREPFTGAQRRLLGAAAPTLSALLSRLDRLQALEAAHEGALRAIGMALELRDHETGGHTDRVTQLAVRLAERLELSAERIKWVRWGAYLHDIGKFGVHDSILLKPGPLTPEERQMMQGHAQSGYDLAADLPFLPETVRLVVLHHHERWDGNGYPYRISGEEIPLEARIFAVCDVFDALTSARPYKRAMSVERALEELFVSAGNGHLEPRLVQAFKEMVLNEPALKPEPIQSESTQPEQVQAEQVQPEPVHAENIN